MRKRERKIEKERMKYMQDSQEENHKKGERRRRNRKWKRIMNNERMRGGNTERIKEM